VIPAAFEYVRPESVEQALAALADPEAKVLAGGHSLLPMMKLRLARPETLVDISALGLRDVRVQDGELRIGALTTYDELLSADVDLPDALREAAAAVGDVQVRNAGTVGGALAHGDPASDFAAAALALGARLLLQSPAGTREVPADGFFLAPFTTGLAEQELLTEIVVPLDTTGSAYVAVEDRASGYPLAGAAAKVTAGGVRVALTGLAAHPQRLREGDPIAALADLETMAAPEEADHRRQLAAVAIRRATERAQARARGGE
jgi:carbon-monoxide dehydrogenase medium subunit